jgi:hypothetical protein
VVLIIDSGFGSFPSKTCFLDVGICIVDSKLDLVPVFVNRTGNPCLVLLEFGVRTSILAGWKFWSTPAPRRASLERSHLIVFMLRLLSLEDLPVQLPLFFADRLMLFDDALDLASLMGCGGVTHHSVADTDEHFSKRLLTPFSVGEDLIGCGVELLLFLDDTLVLGLDLGNVIINSLFTPAPDLIAFTPDRPPLEGGLFA